MNDFLEPGVNGLFESPLAVATKEDLEPVLPRDWWREFLFTRYDWTDPDFWVHNQDETAYYPLVVTQGLFSAIPTSCIGQMTKYPDGTHMQWCAKVQRDERGDINRIYAARRGRLHEPETVLAHRYLMNALYLGNKIVDHGNGRGLDNRGHEGKSLNLRVTTRGVNVTNSRRHRTKNLGLLPGVEAYYGRFRGMRTYRDENGKTCVVRSEEVWDTQEEPHQWYLAEIAKHFGEDMWVHNPKSVRLPFFPRMRDGYDEEKDFATVDYRDHEYKKVLKELREVLDEMFRERMQITEDVPF